MRLVVWPWRSVRWLNSCALSLYSAFAFSGHGFPRSVELPRQWACHWPTAELLTRVLHAPRVVDAVGVMVSSDEFHAVDQAGNKLTFKQEGRGLLDDLAV